MANWKTIHIFHFGDVQVISEDGTGKTKKSESLASLKYLIDDIWNTRPEDFEGTETFHAIHIFKNEFADWHGGDKHFRTKYDELAYGLIDDLADEVLA